MTWFRWHGTELQLELKIQPGARQDAIAGLHAGRLKLKIHAPALDGRANAQLIEFLSRSFDTSKTNVSITHGALGRSKCVRLRQIGCIPPELQALGLI